MFTTSATFTQLKYLMKDLKQRLAEDIELADRILTQTQPASIQRMQLITSWNHAGEETGQPAKLKPTDR